MDANEPSRTAWAAANHRAAHQLLESGSIFRDQTAVPIVAMPPDTIAADARAHPDRTPMRLFIAARHARGDEVVADALARGGRQVVILGAGLDTTAYRLAAPAGTTVFEVDHPATQRWKRDQVAAVGLEPVVDLRYVGVDLERDSLLDALRGAGLEPSGTTVVVWLGVVPYLTGEGIESTWRAVASLSDAELVFDYSEPVSPGSGRAQAWRQVRAERVAALGEPWRSHFEPARLHTRLADAGLDVVRDDHAGDLVRGYLGLPPAPRHRSAGHVLHAVTAGRRTGRSPG